MKKLYASFLTGLLMAAAPQVATAQQLQNSGFEEAWNPCIPYTYYGNAGYTDQLSQLVVGENPAGWVVSNVAGMASFNNGTPTGLGSTTVGSKTAGYESESAVLLTNTPNPFMAAQIVPAYLTLGTTWSTANPGFGIGGITIKNSDGGVFGGQSFTERPKGIEFMYKRTRGEAKPDEKTTVVAYLWKGHWTQKDVPVTVYMTGSPTTVDMTDRDRCVMGMDMTGCQGGEVTKTDDAELIAVINAEITEDAEGWTKFSADFDYKSDATPEMINIVIAAGDYFGGAEAVGNGNSLTVDDFKLVYEQGDDPKPDEPVEGDEYKGQLTIMMMGSQLTELPIDAQVYIDYNDNSTCTLTLPHFTLDLGDGPADLGNIVVENVAVTNEDGTGHFVGQVKDMSLLGGEIIADVDVDGTIDSKGVAIFKINVVWMGIPIVVDFTGNGKPFDNNSGIISIETTTAKTEYYNLKGVPVSADQLNSGIYIIKKGGKVGKVIVR